MKFAGAGQVLLAAALWGTTGTTMALAPAGAEPLGVGALRLLLGGVALAALAFLKGDFRRAGSLPLRKLAGAGLMIAAYQICFFNGVARNGVALGTLVAIGSAPMLAGLLEWRLRGVKPGRRWLVATSLALGGCGLLLLPADGLSPAVEAVGLLLSLGAGLAYTGYALVSKELLQHMSPNAAVAAIFLPGALFLLPLLPLTELTWVLQPRGMLIILHLGLVTTAVAYLLFARGLRQISTAAAVTLTLAEPLVAGMLGVLLLGERFGGRSLAGMMALGAGLLWLSLPVFRGERERHERIVA